MPSGDDAAAPARSSIEILDPADVDSHQAVSSSLALLDLISNPFALAGVRTDKDNGDRCPFHLSGYPVSNRSVVLLADLLEFCRIEESAGLAPFGYPGVANHPSPLDIVLIVEAKERSPRSRPLQGRRGSTRLVPRPGRRDPINRRMQRQTGSGRLLCIANPEVVSARRWELVVEPRDCRSAAHQPGHCLRAARNHRQGHPCRFWQVPTEHHGVACRPTAPNAPASPDGAAESMNAFVACRLATSRPAHLEGRPAGPRHRLPGPGPSNLVAACLRDRESAPRSPPRAQEP